MACANYLCPGNFNVWVNAADALDTGNVIPTDLDRTLFTRLPEVLSWSLEPSVDEPNAFRTADTAGTRVTPCPGGVTWTITITTKICLSNWLYDYILSTPPADGWYRGGNRLKLWWYLGWTDNTAGFPAVIGPTNPGIYFLGTPTPPSISGDNDTDEAAAAEITVNMELGPFIPNL